MKNRMMFGMVAVLFMALLTPCGLWAGTGAGSVDIPRARERTDNAPKTPEELLMRLKLLMENPNISGADFAEKILGVNIEKWELTDRSKPGRRWYSLSRHYDVDLLVDDDGSLISFKLFRKPNIEFCITPKLTKEILGEPSKIGIGTAINGHTAYHIYYVYVGRNDRRISVSYSDIPRSDVSRKKNIISKFENHKNFCFSVLGLIENKPQ